MDLGRPALLLLRPRGRRLCGARPRGGRERAAARAGTGARSPRGRPLGGRGGADRPHAGAPLGNRFERRCRWDGPRRKAARHRPVPAQSHSAPRRSRRPTRSPQGDPGREDLRRRPLHRGGRGGPLDRARRGRDRKPRPGAARAVLSRATDCRPEGVNESWWIVVLPRGGYTGFPDGPGPDYSGRRSTARPPPRTGASPATCARSRRSCPAARVSPPRPPPRALRPPTTGPAGRESRSPAQSQAPCCSSQPPSRSGGGAGWARGATRADVPGRRSEGPARRQALSRGAAATLDPGPRLAVDVIVHVPGEMAGGVDARTTRVRAKASSSSDAIGVRGAKVQLSLHLLTDQ